ncbi:MAG: hypothetical protein FD146_2431 [Anaerolineaceae bacterium]|nr:MAG: hypothetical protein FD146_2431 [Anaerolineaceae bacterium]
MKNLPTLLSNIFIGIPGGALIFMGMLMFNAVLGLLVPAGAWTMLAMLCFTSLVVGLLARLARPVNGFGAAVASGVVAAGIILYLWLTSAPGTGNASAVFGPVGMAAAIAFSTFGGWIFPRLRKRSK